MKLSDWKFFTWIIIVAFLFGSFAAIGRKTIEYAWPDPPFQVEVTPDLDGVQRELESIELDDMDGLERGEFMEAMVTRRNLFVIQVCVPKNWTDEQVVAFTKKASLYEDTDGTCIIRQGDDALCGCDERVQCSDIEDNVHILLDI